MSKKNIVIAGGGFAGVSALRYLRRHNNGCLKEFNVLLADRKEFSEFLPMLPDVVSGRMGPESLCIGLKDLCAKSGADFVHGEIGKIDPGNRRMVIAGENVEYEYAVLATGAETDFFGNEDLKKECHRLYCVQDALSIKRDIESRSGGGERLNVVVVGGGYTGLETATNIKVLLSRMAAPHTVSVIEKAGGILSSLPERIARACRREVKRSGIEIVTGDSLMSFVGREAVLGSGRRIGNALCVWAAGVTTPRVIRDLDADKYRGRIEVGPDLRGKGVAGNVLVCGDSASFVPGGSNIPLRMAVMFSIGQGKTAARNVLNGIRGERVTEYKAVDLGYLLPLATGKAPGKVMGVYIGGRPGFFMHYLMCLYRSSFRNKLSMLKHWIMG